jgi:hypothetical protein
MTDPLPEQRKALIQCFTHMSDTLGVVTTVHDFKDDRLLVIISNIRYTDPVAERRLARIIEDMVAYRLTNLIATDGGWGEIDVGWLRGISDPVLRRDMVEALVDQGKLKASEYVAINSRTPFTLFGADDEDLHTQAQQIWLKIAPAWRYAAKCRTAEELQYEIEHNSELRVLYPDILRFNELDRERAAMILSNLLYEMKKIDTPHAALICTGGLPGYVGELAKARELSYIMVDTAGASGGDLDSYEHTLREQLSARLQDQKTSISPARRGWRHH